MKANTNTKDICVTAIGIAMFVALSMCLRVPIFENYYVCLGYVVMMVWLYSVGTFSGTLVGCIGTLLYCVLIGGLRGMPGWVLGNLVIGLLLGALIKRLNKSKKLLNTILLSVTIFISTFIGILLVKSFTECILYSQPMIVRITTNMTAFISDVLTLVLSIPLCIMIDKHIRKIYKENV